MLDSALVNRTPLPGQPGWYFAALLASLLTALFIVMKYGRKQEDPRRHTLETMDPAPLTACEDHGNRIAALEERWSDFEGAVYDRLAASEGRIRKAIDDGLSTARSEQDGRFNAFRAELKGDLERVEDRLAKSMDAKMSMFQVAVLQQIQALFLKSQGASSPLTGG